MKRLFVLTILLLLVAQHLLAQKNEIDSLKVSFKHASSDSARVNILLDMAVHFLAINLDSMEVMCAKALHLSQNSGYTKGEARSNLMMCVCYRRQGDLPKGLEYCQTALKIANRNMLEEVEADALNNIGVIYNYHGNYPLALEMYQKALVIGETNQNNDQVARTLVNIGGIHYNLKDYDQALMHWQRALDLQLMAGDKNSAGSSMNNIGLTYAHKDDYKNALAWYYRSLHMYDTDQTCARIYPLENIGSTYLETNQTDSAEYYLQQVVTQSAECKDIIIQMSSLTSLSEVYQKQNKVNEALENLKKALEIGTEAGLKRETSITARSLSEIYEQTGNKAKAFEFFKLFHELQDSLYNDENSKSIGRLEAKYEYEKVKREREIEERIKTLEKERIAVREKWIRNSLVIGFLTTIIVAVFIYRSYQRKKTSNYRLRLLNEEIKKQQLVLSDQAEQLRSLNDSLTELNNNLEQKINQRTLELRQKNAELKMKNQKLAEYAFINAHKLRAPVASLLGLVTLFGNREVDLEEKNHIIQKVEESARDLNTIVKEIQIALEKEDFRD